MVSSSQYTGLLVVCICLAFAAVDPVRSATTHQHTHSHHNRERLEDGSIAPRDARHHHADSAEDDGLPHDAEFDHEAILGSVRAAEEFDQLSPGEAKIRLRRIAHAMDTNADGFVDRHELKAWILRSFRNLAREEADERLEGVDVNGDRSVSWTEYILDTYNMDGDDDLDNSTLPMMGSLDPLHQQNLMHRSEDNKLINDDREMFAAADLDGNGELSAEEFVAFNSPEDFPHMYKVVLNQTLRDKDRNGDGYIDFQEFIGGTAANHDKEWLLAEKEKFDASFDVDGDGHLNRSEILMWIIPSSEEIATEEVDHLFVTADDNHDDRLDIEEIVDHSETFVGSEATDFGDQLESYSSHDEL